MKEKSYFACLFLTVLLATVGLLFMAGCDDDDPTDNEPTVTPTPGPPTATPSPTPMTNQTWTRGKAVINVTGIKNPWGEEDKGVIFSLDGINCECAWIRLRSREGIPRYQAKMFSYSTAPSECWDEINYWETLPACDGDWVVEWGHENGKTWVNFMSPEGFSEILELPHIIGFNRVVSNAGPCVRPPIHSPTNAVPIIFEGLEEGCSNSCPYH